MADQNAVMREFAASVPHPDLGDVASVMPPTLREARVAIVTSAALTLPGEVSKRQAEKWEYADYDFATLETRL